jgi:hypothetical protein
MPMDLYGQAFDKKDGLPPLPEAMVPYYESLIPVALEDRPADVPKAQAALAARDQMALEKILNPDLILPEFVTRSQSLELSPEEEEALMRDLEQRLNEDE